MKNIKKNHKYLDSFKHTFILTLRNKLNICTKLKRLYLDIRKINFKLKLTETYYGIV